MCVLSVVCIKWGCGTFVSLCESIKDLLRLIPTFLINYFMYIQLNGLLLLLYRYSPSLAILINPTLHRSRNPTSEFNLILPSDTCSRQCYKLTSHMTDKNYYYYILRRVTPLIPKLICPDQQLMNNHNNILSTNYNHSNPLHNENKIANEIIITA